MSPEKGDGLRTRSTGERRLLVGSILSGGLLVVPLLLLGTGATLTSADPGSAGGGRAAAGASTRPHSTAIPHLQLAHYDWALSASTSEVSGDCGPPYDPTDGTGVTCAQFLEWSQVAVCEEGGWVGADSADYPDSLGISAANWRDKGGTSDVAPDAQIVVAQRIQTDPPDQGRCNGSW